jgi:hypothetical protein
VLKVNKISLRLLSKLDNKVNLFKLRLSKNKVSA